MAGARVLSKLSCFLTKLLDNTNELENIRKCLVACLDILEYDRMRKTRYVLAVFMSLIVSFVEDFLLLEWKEAWFLLLGDNRIVT